MNIGVIDDGYGDIKFINHLGDTEFIPSFVTDFKEKPLESLSNSYQQNKSYKYLACEVDGVKYVIGDYAVKLDSNSRWVGGENKHKDYRFPILLKTTLGLMSSRISNKTFDTLMMNLPIRYDTPERRCYLENTVRGTHNVAISTDGINFTKKSIIVNHVDIKKQPFGSLCDIILDSQGQIIEPIIAKGFNVIVDIGARTLNILTLEALEEQPELTIQTNDGMFVAYNQIGSYLEKELGVIIPDGKLPQIIQNKEIKGRDITPLIEQVYRNHANTILSILDKVLINSYGFVTNIIFTGGGAEVLRPYLRPITEMVSDNKLTYLDRYATARGLGKYGIRQFKKKVSNESISVRVGNHEYRYK